MESKEKKQPGQFPWWESVFGESPKSGRTLSLVGAGGKTTLGFTLAHELAESGFRVAVTTTTHIFYPDACQSRYVVTDGDQSAIERALAVARLVTVGVPAEEGKLSAPTETVLRGLREAADVLIIEADGSRRFPVKVPREGEPVLWAGTDMVAAVCGMRCLGEPIGRVCHRYTLAQKLLGVEEDHCLTPGDVAALLYRSYAECVNTAFILNQADACPWEQTVKTAENLLALGAKRVVASSLQKGELTVF